MKEECIICKAPLIYLEKDEMMECVLCHKKELSKTRCEQGHYVCNECHTKGMGVIIDICLSETSKNPIEIIRRMMAQPFCHMHGPEHHVMVGSALLTAYKNAGGEIDLPEALLEMMNRGKAVPGGVCGFWGACGAGISTGMFISIISGATPLKNEPWGLANKMTSKALDAIGSIGGPRCCKRDSYIAIISAIDYVAENFNIQMEKPVIKCIHSACGAGISTGMFISIISGATPLKNEPWGLANKMTSKALDAIGSIGGPRCCKRDSYIAIISAIDYVAENFNIQMEKPVIKCIHSDKNNQCIKERCPFHE